MTHRQLKQKALSKKTVKKEYDELRVEFSLLKQFLTARKKAGLTQAEVAKKMGTKAPAVTRLEASLATGSHSPKLVSLEKYASAIGCHLSIKLVRA